LALEALDLRYWAASTCSASILLHEAIVRLIRWWQLRGAAKSFEEGVRAAAKTAKQAQTARIGGK